MEAAVALQVAGVEVSAAIVGLPWEGHHKGKNVSSATSSHKPTLVQYKDINEQNVAILWVLWIVEENKLDIAYLTTHSGRRCWVMKRFVDKTPEVREILLLLSERSGEFTAKYFQMARKHIPLRVHAWLPQCVYIFSISRSISLPTRRP